jgi:hypothetical protein
VRGHVTLAVFNTVGQQVALLQDGEQEAGYHEVRFDARGLSTGVYFYRMQVRTVGAAQGGVRPAGSIPGGASGDGAGSFTETKKLLLVR